MQMDKGKGVGNSRVPGSFKVVKKVCHPSSKIIIFHNNYGAALPEVVIGVNL